jgi:transposase InsO family protein
MGLTGCPASFARLMDVVMRDAPNVLTYIDDVLIHSVDLSAHLSHVREAFNRLRTHNLKLNLEKCHIASNKVAYLGHTLTTEGVLPGLDKTKAIREARTPATPKEVRSFLGLANYFRNYILHFATIATPLFRLTRASSEWREGPLPPDALKAFRTIQAQLSKGPVMAYPTREGKLHLFVDASLGTSSDTVGEEGGLGACLMQEDGQGVKRVVAYASRRLLKHETNYSAFLLEMQAAVFALDHFDIYLKGRPFVLYTDHRPLEALSHVHKKTLNRLQQKMLEHQFEIRYIKGPLNNVADYLSRSCGLGCAPVQLDERKGRNLILQMEQDKDPQLLNWKKVLRNEPTDVPVMHPLFGSMGIYDDILYIQMSGRKGIQDRGHYRVVTPVQLRAQLIKEAHDSNVGGHGGFFKTSERIKQLYWWPNMDHDIQTHVRQCQVCLRVTNKGTTPPPPMTSLPPTTAPNKRLHIDLYGPLLDKDKNKKWVCVMTDAFTKIVRLASIASKEASVIAQTILKEWIYVFGVPQVIVSDGGLEFCNKLNNEMFKVLKMNHVTTSPYHPQTNAQAEVFNKTMGHYLRAVVAQHELTSLDWEPYLGPLMFSHNTAVHKATMTTPHYTMFGYDPRAPLWPDQDVLAWDTDEVVKGDPTAQLRTTQHLIRQTAHHNNQHYRDQYADDRAKHTVTQVPVYRPGQRVLVQIEAPKKGTNKKLEPKWEDGEIIEQTSLSTYKVRRLTRKRKKESNLNAERIKPHPETPEGRLPTTTDAQIPEGTGEDQPEEVTHESEDEDGSEEEDEEGQEEDDDDDLYAPPPQAQAKAQKGETPLRRSTRTRKPRYTIDCLELVVAATKNAARDIIENKENPMELTVTLANLYKMMEEAARNGARIIGRSLLMPGAPAPAPAPVQAPPVHAPPQQGPVQPQPGPPPQPPPLVRRPTIRGVVHKVNKELAKLASFNKSPPQAPLPAKRVKAKYNKYDNSLNAILDAELKRFEKVDVDLRLFERLDRVTKAFISRKPHDPQ